LLEKKDESDLKFPVFPLNLIVELPEGIFCDGTSTSYHLVVFIFLPCKIALILLLLFLTLSIANKISGFVKPDC